MSVEDEISPWNAHGFAATARSNTRWVHAMAKDTSPAPTVQPGETGHNWAPVKGVSRKHGEHWWRKTWNYMDLWGFNRQKCGFENSWQSRNHNKMEVSRDFTSQQSEFEGILQVKRCIYGEVTRENEMYRDLTMHKFGFEGIWPSTIWSYAEGIHRKCRAQGIFNEGSITRLQAYMSNQTHGPLSLGS